MSVTLAPYLSVLEMVLDSVCGVRRGLPPTWRRRVSDSIGAPDRRFVRPLVAAGLVVPDVVVPIIPRFDSEVHASVEAIRGASVEQVEHSVHRLFGDHPSAPWQAVLRDPARWVDGFGRAIASAWAAIEPLWAQVTPVIDREVERVGVATVRRQLPILLGGVSNRMRLVDTDIVYDHPTHGSYDLADRRVVLVPLVGGDHSLISDYDQTDIAWLGYPLPGVGNCWRSGRPTDDDSDLLGTLIGPHRAAIMRLMDRPITMQEIARALRYAPSTITFHCDWLTDAGLLWRDKRGRSVHAGRTPRGERLLTVMR